MLTSLPLTVTYGRIAVFNKLNENRLGNSLVNLASGSKVRKPENNVTDYFHAQRLNLQAENDNRIGRNISEGSALLKVASDAGEIVLRGVNRLKEITNLYYKDSSDQDLKSALTAEFTALKDQIGSTINNATYDGLDLITDSGASPLKNIIIDENSQNAIAISFSSDQITDVSGLTLGVDENTERGAVENQLRCAGSYLARASSLSRALDAHYAIVSKKASVSSVAKNVLTKTDTGNEMFTSVNRSIQHQSSIALMAQANIINSSVVRLFG